jgi:hypothetical protein
LNSHSHLLTNTFLAAHDFLCTDKSGRQRRRRYGRRSLTWSSCVWQRGFLQDSNCTVRRQSTF